MLKKSLLFAVKVLVFGGPAVLLATKAWWLQGIAWFVVALSVYVLFLLKREGVPGAALWWVAGVFVMLPLLASATLTEVGQRELGPFTFAITHLEVDGLPFTIAIALCATFFLALVAYFADYMFVSQGCPSLWHAVRYLILGMLGFAGSYRVIDDSQVSELKAMGPMVSEGRSGKILVIQNEQAIVLDRAGESPRVVGPGVVFTKPFERVRKVISTRRQFARGKLENAPTKDGLFLSFEFGVLYRIMRDYDTHRDNKADHPFSTEAVLKATYNTFDVRMAAVTVAQNLLRDQVAKYYMDDLYDPLRPSTFPLGRIKQEVRNGLTQIASSWGVEIQGFNITNVIVPDEVQSQMLDQWKVEWVNRATVAKAEADAEQDRVRKLARVRAESELLDIMAQFFNGAGLVGNVNDVVKLRFAEALECLVSDPVAREKLVETVRAMRGIDHFIRDVEREDFFA